MATLREIRRRISGVKNTQKITKAMKMVAAAKLRRAQEAVIAARPYARKMQELLQKLSNISDPTVHPLFEKREVESVALIIVTADRGLCGAFNSNIIRTAVQHINSNYENLHKANKVNLICVGRKSADFFGKNNYKISGKYTGIYADLNFSHAQTIIGDATRGFTAGEYDKVEIIYNEFKSIAQQRIVTEQILPIQPLPATDTSTKAGTSNPKSVLNYIFEPSSDAIILSLIPKHLNFQIWHALLESNAAEQGARMAAMDNATSNATDMIKALQLSYNKARQSSITKELLEIVSGAEALKAS
ncbi:MAG: ATP synthase F1 subunit gamma [Ignavibacteriales bacterium]|nr:ATP synthase F1 subunit gamma [Ignavibacteriales bacterium]